MAAHLIEDVSLVLAERDALPEPVVDLALKPKQPLRLRFSRRATQAASTRAETASTPWVRPWPTVGCRCVAAYRSQLRIHGARRLAKEDSGRGLAHGGPGPTLCRLRVACATRRPEDACRSRPQAAEAAMWDAHLVHAAHRLLAVALS